MANVVQSWVVPSGTTTASGTNYGGAHYSFEWTSSVKSAGVTTISWELYARGWYSSSRLDSSCLLTISGSDGSSLTLCDFGNRSGEGRWQYFNDALVGSGSFDIEHNDSGEASFTVSFTIHIYDWTRHSTTSAAQELPNNKPSYTVTVNMNTGIDGAKVNEIYTSGEPITVTAGESVTVEAIPSTGYSFSHWIYEDEEVTDNPWLVLSSISADTEVTVHAEENSITVYYDGNGADVAKLDGNDQTGVHSEIYSYHSEWYQYGLDNIQSDSHLYFSREGYNITGNWQTEDGSIKIAQDKPFYGHELATILGKPIDTSDESVTLYVEWQPITYEISVDCNGGEGVSPTILYTIETSSFILDTPVRPGYKFLGWTGSNGDIPEVLITIEQGSMNDRNYIANWEALATIYTKDDNNWPAGAPYVKVKGDVKKAIGVYAKVGNEWKFSVR